MRTRLIQLALIRTLCSAVTAFGATHYADLNSTNATPPYATWATAATNIQDAVGAAAAGDAVVVTNGVYPGGLAVNTPLTLLSVNGPQFTVINGGGTKQCAALTDGASLTGFTLTNGSIPVSNSSYEGGGGVSCASTNTFLTNCVIVGNSASSQVAGGASGGTLYNCTLANNSAAAGGGAYQCTLYNCTLTGNSGSSGAGGASECTLYNCTLTGNSAYRSGGGAMSCNLYNCIAYFNTAPMDTNYDVSSTLNYCCTTPLPATGAGNIALNPQLAGASRLSADSPCSGAGSPSYATGTDIDGEPWANPPSIGCDEYHAGAVTGPLTVSLLASYTNITVGYGLSMMALVDGRPTETVWDFGDGNVATNQPYVTHIWTQAGHYLVALRAFNESHEDGVSAFLAIDVVAQPVCYVAVTGSDPQPPYATWATAATNIQDALDVAAAGEAVVVTNGVYLGGLAVNTPLTLLSVNGPQVTVINGRGTNECAKLTSAASLSGFTLTNGWARTGGGVWCSSAEAFLTNCVIAGNWAGIGSGAYYSTLYNCTLSNNFAVVRGGGAFASTLYNCTLSSNSVASGYGIGDGGGAYACTLYDCTLSANSANGEYGYGGGASECTLYNCMLTGNSASDGGGGARASTLYNCTLTGNSAVNAGGGVLECTLYNCIAYFNKAASGGANCDSYGYSRLNYCCTTPIPTNGVGNITNAPLFVDYGNGDLHLQSNSPCINAGNNAYVFTATDLDGNPRIVSGTVDIGAYEYQGTGSLICYAWLQYYGLSTDGLADFADTDGDGMNNWQEWICGTNPRNAASILKMLAPSKSASGITVNWESVDTRTYFLQRGTNLVGPPAFTTLQSNLLGQAGTTTYTDTTATNGGPYFYRVGVQ